MTRHDATYRMAFSKARQERKSKDDMAEKHTITLEVAVTTDIEHSREDIVRAIHAGIWERMDTTAGISIMFLEAKRIGRLGAKKTGE